MLVYDHLFNLLYLDFLLFIKLGQAMHKHRKNMYRKLQEDIFNNLHIACMQVYILYV